MCKIHNYKTKHFILRIIFPIAIILVTPILITLNIPYFLKSIIGTKYEILFNKIIATISNEKLSLKIIMDVNEFNSSYAYIIIGIIIFGGLIVLTRRLNSEKTFNYPTEYINYANGYFKIGKFFGYKSIDIRRIPIYSFFYILKKGIFQISSLEKLEQNIPAMSCSIKYVNNIDNKNNKILNIVLEDTFDIDKEELSRIMEQDSNYIHIKIEKDKKNVRLYCQEFVDKSIESINSAKGNFEEIHLYTSTNPLHNVNIFENIITPIGRDNKTNLYIHSSKPDNNGIHRYYDYYFKKYAI